jgi:PAS domain-containing protein
MKEKEFPGWQDTFESAMDIIALISENFDILKINKVAYKNLNKTPDQVIGKKCYKVIHGLDAPIAGCACKLAKETGRGAESEIFDRGRYYLTTAAPIYDKNNKFVAFKRYYRLKKNGRIIKNRK